MITRNATTVTRFLASSWRSLTVLLGVSILAELAYQIVEVNVLPLQFEHVGLLGTALSILLVFRVNEAYDRWWEARKLWGQLVNTSRAFARQALTLVPDREISAQLIRRQIGYVYALRTALRHGPRWQTSVSDWQAVVPFVDPEELEGLKTSANVPTQLVKAHGLDLRKAFDDSPAAHLLLVELDESLNRLYDIQGGCERIKNTVFPDRVARFTRAFVWVFALALPFVILDSTPDARDLMKIMLATFMSFVLVTVEALGRELKNPFENRPNDTPMTALSRTIEIDLLQFLGETELPEPLKAEDGVLM